MPLPHIALALKEVIAYLETGDKTHLQEAKKSIEDLEVRIDDYQKQMEAPRKKRRRP